MVVTDDISHGFLGCEKYKQCSISCHLSFLIFLDMIKKKSTTRTKVTDVDY